MFAHQPHYTRQWIVDTCDHNEHLPDSRQKMHVTFHDESGRSIQILVDPKLWFQASAELIHTIPMYLPAPDIFQQIGPTCGLYALKIIDPSLEVAELLHKAQELNMSVVGEMFCVHELAELAARFGLTCAVISIDTVPTWFNTQEGCALIPYDSDTSGISFRKGANAHWGIVWTIWSVYSVYDDMEMACLMTHSSAVLPAVERWTELRESNTQLERAQVRVDSQWKLELSACCLAGWAVWVQKTKK